MLLTVQRTSFNDNQPEYGQNVLRKSDLLFVGRLRYLLIFK